MPKSVAVMKELRYAYVLLVQGSGCEDLMSSVPRSYQPITIFLTIFLTKKTNVSVLPVDHSARGSMKNAANCDK